MKKLLLSTIAMVGLTVSAMAADLPLREMPPAFEEVMAPAPVAPAYSWTGLYAGVHAGTTWQDHRVHRGEFAVNGVVLEESDFDDPILAAIFPPSAGERSRNGGFMGGAQVGYNLQFGMMVIGAEADISYLGGGQKTTTVTASDGQGMNTNMHFRRQMDWLGTTRLRAGIAIDRLLVYGTGGLAFGDLDNRIDFTADDGVNPAMNFAGRNSGWKMGWTAGAGMEYAFTDRMSLKTEWLYYNLGKTSVTATSEDMPGFRGAYDFENKGHLARIGLNWKF